MAGFLDKNTRVVDMVLTDYGRELYSKGELEFSFYAFSDDGVDYDPYVSTSSSLNQVEITASKIDQIDDTLVREAVSGYQKCMDSAARDTTNIKDLMFTIPQGQKVLPEMLMSADITTGSLEAMQQKVQEVYVTLDQFGDVISKTGPIDRGFKKFKGTRLHLDLSIQDFLEKDSRDGFLLRVFVSGSSGLVEIDPRRDFKDALSYLGDVRVFKDDEINRLEKGIVDRTSVFEQEQTPGAHWKK